MLLLQCSDLRCVYALVVQMCTNHLRKKHYTHAQALQWAIQIARGLKYLHTSKPKVLCDTEQRISVNAKV